MRLGSFIFLMISLVIGVALYYPILDIINGKFDIWTIIFVVIGSFAALYHLAIFIAIECEKRKKC